MGNTVELCTLNGQPIDADFGIELQSWVSVGKRYVYYKQYALYIAQFPYRDFSFLNEGISQQMHRSFACS